MQASTMPDYRHHAEYIALTRAVLVAPADDLPRLVLADWLDEHGQPDRAAFIRTQVQHPEAFGGRELLDDSTDPPDWYCDAITWLTGGAADAELQAVVVGRCRGIPNRPEWERQASGKGWRLRVVWQRGFIVEVRCNEASGNRYLNAIVAAHPVLRCVPTDAPRGTILSQVFGRHRLKEARRAAGLESAETTSA